jgi:D-alanyl-D-alanine carboxypeptidase/D-alanyl-D-alanine-endopeptidase (penicillin-binding protein 4)
MKTLTAASALASVGPSHQLSTKVMANPNDKTRISLVGGGDITLSNTAVGAQSVYKDAPKLSSLAAQVQAWAASNGVAQLSEINLDSTLFVGSGWEESWQRKDQVDGWISEVTALQIDGDRTLPEFPTSPKTGRPIASAGELFKTALGALANNATLVQGATPASFIEIGSVQSQPMSKWITHLLQTSDNTETEALGRIVALDAGFDGSYDSLDAAFKKVLEDTELDFKGVSVRDSSGLSALNMVPPIFMAELMRLVDAGYGQFDLIKSSLPVAGKSGTLSDRFKGDIADAAGKIVAKTGYLPKVYTLNGIIDAKDGTSLTFAIYAIGDVGSDVRLAIDTLATAFYRCGNTLSND